MKFAIGVLTWVILLSSAAVWANPFDDTVSLFRKAGPSAAFFNNCYGYAVFPTIGEGAWVIGGAHGTGRVYEHGKYVGDTSVTQLSVGLQAGGQAYSQIVFLKDRRAFKEFTKGDFEFGADVNAVAITASAGVNVATTGAGAEASINENNAAAAAKYYKGMAVFTLAKGGAMYQAAVSGEKFSYTPRV